LMLRLRPDMPESQVARLFSSAICGEPEEFVSFDLFMEMCEEHRLFGIEANRMVNVPKITADILFGEWKKRERLLMKTLEHWGNERIFGVAVLRKQLENFHTARSAVPADPAKVLEKYQYFVLGFLKMKEMHGGIELEELEEELEDEVDNQPTP